MHIFCNRPATILRACFFFPGFILKSLSLLSFRTDFLISSLSPVPFLKPLIFALFRPLSLFFVLSHFPCPS